jgi:hypothetical protein
MNIFLTGYFLDRHHQWAISMNSDVKVKGLEADVDVGFKDILDKLNFAGMLVYGAQKALGIVGP